MAALVLVLLAAGFLVGVVFEAIRLRARHYLVRRTPYSDALAALSALNRQPEPEDVLRRMSTLPKEHR